MLSGKLTVWNTLRGRRASQSSHRSPGFRFLPVSSSWCFCLVSPQCPTCPGAFPVSPIQRRVTFSSSRDRAGPAPALSRALKTCSNLTASKARPLQQRGSPSSAPLTGSRSRGGGRPGGTPCPAVRGTGILPAPASGAALRAERGPPRAGAAVRWASTGASLPAVPQGRAAAAGDPGVPRSSPARLTRRHTPRCRPSLHTENRPAWK